MKRILVPRRFKLGYLSELVLSFPDDKGLARDPENYIIE